MASRQCRPLRPLGRTLVDRRADRLVGEYAPTAKNALVCDLYPRLGFSEIDRTGASVLYALPLDDARAGAAVDFIELCERSAAKAAPGLGA